MAEKLRVSMIQMRVTNQVEENVETAIELIKEAAKSNPDVVILPENFHILGRKKEVFEAAETINGPTLTKLRGLANELGIYIVAGTMNLRVDGSEKLKNTCCVINPKEKSRINTKKYIFLMLRLAIETLLPEK